MSEQVFEGLDPEVRDRTKTMLMYFIVFAVTMLFAGFTSAYIVSNMGQYWVHVEAPGMFWVSNVMIALSSASLWWATRCLRAGQTSQTLLALGLTLALGIGFTLTQAEGWRSLSDIGMGWNTTDTEQGKAFRWNNLQAIYESEAIYGQDYDIRYDGKPLLHDAARGELYASDDALMVQPITVKVLQSSNSGGGYIWALVGVHIVHLVFGLVYLVVNAIRVWKGTIHAGDTVRLKALGIYWHFLGLLWLYLFAFLFFMH
jgi:heme/copper-type cytochrome/quinol oxidase subunit 3